MRDIGGQHARSEGDGGEPLSELRARAESREVEPASELGIYREIPDNRAGFAPHPVWEFAVAPTKGSVAYEFLDLLGVREAEKLLNMLRHHYDLSKPLVNPCTLALFLDSDGKATRRTPQFENEPTTQEEDLRFCSYRHADALIALVYTARLQDKARQLGLALDHGPDFWARKQEDRFRLLSEGEQAALTRLGDGAIAANIGVAAIAHGHLCFALESRPMRSPRLWAWGSPCMQSGGSTTTR